MNIRKAVVGSMIAFGLVSIPLAAQARVDIDVSVGPPPDRVTVVPAPREGYVWAPGYWRWDHGHHVWVDGHWVRARHGYHWVPHHWDHRGERWHFEAGHWDRD
jgi:hypothetical protein